MSKLLEPYRDLLAELCRRYGVKRLDLFGSAARGDFHEATSDFDFLVDFEDRGWQGLSDRYFGLLHSLEDLLGRRVDFVDRHAAKPGFLAAAERHKEALYAS